MTTAPAAPPVIEVTEPGVYHDMPEDIYHRQRTSLSSTHARRLAEALLTPDARPCDCPSGDVECVDGVIWAPCWHTPSCEPPDLAPDGTEAISWCQCACHAAEREAAL